MVTIETNIVFTRAEAEKLYCHKHREEVITNSDTISNIISYRYHNFPALFVRYFEIKHEAGYIYDDTYELKIVIESLFSDN
mgnify:CR=1 FL=1